MTFDGKMGYSRWETMKDWMKRCGSIYNGNRVCIGYLGYTALETDLLFYMVCDTLFLTQAKGISAADVSLLTFLALLFSLMIQYPLLRWINRAGNKRAVRAGSIAFLLSAVCITFAPNFAVILLGGFLKCIAHTLTAMGPAVLKNRLTEDNRQNQYVACQSDANSAASLCMLVTALLCGPLFQKNPYYPMYACMILAALGIWAAFSFSAGDDSRNEIKIMGCKKASLGSQGGFGASAALLLCSFAVFTALTGVGLSYAKLNIQWVLANCGMDDAVMLISMATTLIYLLRVLSNLLTRSIYARMGNRLAAAASFMLLAGLLLQAAAGGFDGAGTVIALSVGYLLLAFVRDPYITLIQNISLEGTDLLRQQELLIKLNAAKKLGALGLSAAATLLLHEYNVSVVMLLMILAAVVNAACCLAAICR